MIRFSDRITFVAQEESYYDPNTSEWVESESVKVTKPCKLSALGVSRKNELFGDIQEDVQVARLQHPHELSYNSVEVRGKQYKVSQQSNYRKGVLFIVRDSLGD